MTETESMDTPGNLVWARAQGRKEGFAIAALALGLLCFVNLLGAEKGLLALVLGWLALKDPASASARRNAKIAIGLALLQIATIALVLILFHDKFAQLIALLHKLG